jgi:transcriptional regulator with XRE-family HTH domain
VSRLQVPVHAGCMDPSALIRQARHAAGLTQRELARRAGVTRAALSHYERRRRIPTIATLEAVLAGAGQQVRAELEQLDADVERAIAAVADQPMADRDGVFGWGQIHRIAEVSHRVEGLAAASVRRTVLASVGLHRRQGAARSCGGRRATRAGRVTARLDPGPAAARDRHRRSRHGRTLRVMRRHLERAVGSDAAGVDGR